MAMMLAVVLATQVGKTSEPDEIQKLLPASTRPYIELAKFKNMKCVSVSEFRSRNSETKQLVIGRVYRFSYMADYATEWKQWAKEYVKKDGWTVGPDNDHTVQIYERTLKHPQVTEQALMLHKGKLVPDAKTKVGSKRINDPEWVWVSFNELLTTKKW